MLCTLCPRRCGALRTASAGSGFCRMPSLPVVARAMLHHWEEPCISGTNGSGAVFFSGCVLGCVFCQNGPISRERFGKAISNMKTRGKSRTGTGVGICSKPSWRMETAWMPLCATATIQRIL